MGLIGSWGFLEPKNVTGVCASDLGLERCGFGAQLHLLRFPLLGVGIPKTCWNSFLPFGLGFLT